MVYLFAGSVCDGGDDDDDDGDGGGGSVSEKCSKLNEIPIT